MALYLKKLRNTEDLEREKLRLLKEKKRIEKEGFFPGKGKEKKGSDEAESDGSFLENIPASLASMAWPVGGLVAGIIKNRLGGNGSIGGSLAKTLLKKGLKGSGRVLGSTAKELIGGYLKWKAVELGYKGLTLVVKRQKRKKAERIAKKEAENEHGAHAKR